jgi:hypothetical protein
VEHFVNFNEGDEATFGPGYFKIRELEDFSAYVGDTLSSELVHLGSLFRLAKQGKIGNFSLKIFPIRYVKLNSGA